MKKLFALLLACSMITCAFTACGNEEAGSGESSDKSSSSQVSESSESLSESSDDESDSDITKENSQTESEEISDGDSDSSQAEKVAITAGKANDEKLIGTWTNDELSASYSSIRFSKDGIISAVVDCSTIMCISGDYLNMSGTDCPYEFDGTDFSCVITSADMGITDPEVEMQELSILEMTKLEPSDKSDINGAYLLTGGMLKDMYAESLPMQGDIYVTVSNNSDIVMEVQVCGYDADGEVLTWKGDAKAILGIDSNEEAITPYNIDGDTLTISGSTEEVLTRNKDIYSKKVKTTTQPTVTKKATTTKVTTKVTETQAKKETTEKATTTIEIVNEAEPTQLYLDFFEPYVDSINNVSPESFQYAKADTLAKYDVDIQEGNEEDLWTFTIKDNNGNEVFLCFYPININDDASEWINTLTLITYDYENGQKEISISDNFHLGKIEYKTFDQNRDPVKQTVSNVDELKKFMLE